MKDGSLRSGFLARASETPDAVALTLRGRDFSYAELDRTARTWAAALIERAGKSPARVAVFGARSEVSYAGALAALYSGAAFVPLNPKFPANRTREMLRLADVDVLLAGPDARAQIDEIFAGLETHPPVLMAGDASAAGPLADPVPVTDADIAYMLFTSGSTGTPKGVPVTHANVRHFIDVVTERYAVTRDDRVSQTFDQTFDLSIFDLFVAWQSGARVCVPEPIDLVAPTAFIRKHQITVWFSVPSIVTLMRRKGLLAAGSLPTLRWSLFCGEALPRASAEAWQDAAPNSIVENLYGPTELTIACLAHRWDPRSSPALCVNDVVAIGRPFEHLEAAVLDDRLTPAAPGEPGELCISGPQTVPGYWRDPVRTQQSFVRPPHADRVFYRTGDRVRETAGGEFVYLGRVDEQLKVRGYRVEPGEIEAVLREDARVADAVAIGWPVDSGSALGIVAFVSGKDVDVAALDRAAASRLPDYMRPGEIVPVQEMPLNANGKVDRRALRQRLEEQEIFLELQRLAAAPYSDFVFDSEADETAFWRLLFTRGVAEFSPPHGRLCREDGRVVGLIACLGRNELQATRLRAAAALAGSGFFSARPDAQRRVQLAARAAIGLQPGDYYLSRLAVVAGCRHRGVGSRLVAGFEAEARGRGCTRLTLEVSADNASARRFYETCGFAEIDRSAVRDDATGRTLDYVHMAKTVA